MSAGTCRLCHGWKGVTLRYSTRSYAHLSCGYKKHGISFLDRLKKSQLSKIPYIEAQELGVLSEVIRRYEGAA